MRLILAIFFGSFLLFGIQPMMGRLLLPSFGGSAAVWTACLAAYQILLLAGYGYAHFVSKLVPRRQRALHLSLLALAVVWTAAFAAFLEPLRELFGKTANPTLEVVFTVALLAGVPYVLLASGSSLLQAWKAASDEGDSRNVYRLYAVSNLGSFLGLFIHPLVLEPFVSIQMQWRGFAVLTAVYFVAVFAVMSRTGSRCPAQPQSPAPQPDADDPIIVPQPRAISHPVFWFLIPTLSSAFLVAYTNHATLDISPLPLLWAAILGLFLLSYCVAFSSFSEDALPALAVISAISLAILPWSGGMLFQENNCLELLRELKYGLPAFFLVLTFLHAWLYKIRPHGSKLTKYYLANALGGATGGLLAGVLPPFLLKTVAEYPAVLFLVAAFSIWFICGFIWPLKYVKTFLNKIAFVYCGAVPFLLLYAERRYDKDGETILRDRSFYGIIRVVAVNKHGGGEPAHRLTNGKTTHGSQYRGVRSMLPTTYYSPCGGGIAINSNTNFIQGKPIRVGVVGLGAGSLAAYGREGDEYRFYEINPDVADCASNPAYFSFLSDTPAKTLIILGDARKTLQVEEATGAPKFDVLIIDAYSGDGIPLQVATDEAFDLYRARLAPDGILSMHISNWLFDLLPLCKAQMKRTGMFAVGTVTADRNVTNSRWVFFADKPFEPVVTSGKVSKCDWSAVADQKSVSDDFGSTLSFVQWNILRRSPKPKAEPVPTQKKNPHIET